MAVSPQEATARTRARPPVMIGDLLKTRSQELITAGVIVGLFLAWELAVRLFGIPQYLLPGPLAIAQRIVADFEMLLPHIWITTYEVLLGLGVSIAVGIPLAIGIVYSRLFERVAYTIIVASQTIPKVALAPIIVIWFGYGLTSKVVVAFLISFFPIVVNTVVGMKSLEREMLYLARSLGASELQIFLNFRLPKALPTIFGGLKVATTLAVIGAVVGEFIAANKGLGYVQLLANGNLDTVLNFATVALLSLVGIVLFAIVSILEQIVIKWEPSDAAS
ncbi:MAG: ABC transporter permease [Chloroflexota bacterium]